MLVFRSLRDLAKRKGKILLEKRREQRMFHGGGGGGGVIGIVDGSEAAEKDVYISTSRSHEQNQQHLTTFPPSSVPHPFPNIPIQTVKPHTKLLDYCHERNRNLHVGSSHQAGKSPDAIADQPPGRPGRCRLSPDRQGNQYGIRRRSARRVSGTVRIRREAGGGGFGGGCYNLQNNIGKALGIDAEAGIDRHGHGSPLAPSKSDIAVDKTPVLRMPSAVAKIRSTDHFATPWDRSAAPS